jgi:3-oxoadipate CoA-transferase alpha subunit
MLAQGKEVRRLNGHDYVLEMPIKGDFALIRAERADRWGNLVYHASARNFGPVMASAATVTAVQARKIVELGALDPEAIVTPGIYVRRVVCVPNPQQAGRQ